MVEKQSLEQTRKEILLAQEEADKMNLQLRQEMILRKAIYQIKHQTMLGAKSNLQKAFFLMKDNWNLKN